mmetsp:Transcript_49845/g.128249  ORF Transcript_49845/g.128249 Transcript_49845/m.128249 type:complete len:82 (+) Transcript_49845:1117-1362(+)
MHFDVAYLCFASISLAFTHLLPFCSALHLSLFVQELLIPDDTKLTVPTSVRLIVEVGEHAPNEVPSKCANVVLPNEEEEDE